MTDTRTQARADLPPHPTARHTWSPWEHVTDEEHFDEMPMAADGEIYEPTEQPRHRADA